MKIVYYHIDNTPPIKNPKVFMKIQINMNSCTKFLGFIAVGVICFILCINLVSYLGEFDVYLGA